MWTDFPTDEEAAEREALMERDELIDIGYYDAEPNEAPAPSGICDLCLSSKDGDHPTLCLLCAKYDRWHREHFGAWS